MQAAGSRFLQGRTRRMTAALRLARQRRAPPDQVVASFVNGALLGIDREARLLDAFLKDSLPERELYDALRAAVERPRRPLGGGGFALEVLLLCLRGEVLDRSVPSARSAARHALGAELSGHVVAALGL